MKELEEAIEHCKFMLRQSMLYISKGHQKALLLVIEAAERSEADINLSFHQKAREVCKSVHTCYRCSLSCNCLFQKQNIAEVLPNNWTDPQIKAFIEKVLEEK